MLVMVFFFNGMIMVLWDLGFRDHWGGSMCVCSVSLSRQKKNLSDKSNIFGKNILRVKHRKEEECRIFSCKRFYKHNILQRNKRSLYQKKYLHYEIVGKSLCKEDGHRKYYGIWITEPRR